MDNNIKFLNVDLNHVPADPIPDTIILDHSVDRWLVNWKTNDAVDKWAAKEYEQEEEAWQVEGKFISFASRFCSRNKSQLLDTEPAQRGFFCDQALLPGMSQHWGELRSCEQHPQEQDGVRVCNGCRISHCLLDSRTFDRRLIMAQGARVSACEKCAAEAIGGYAVDQGACECDSRWTCSRCRGWRFYW